ncbi:MAG: 4Fe-4S dicluster domain-containing protein [Desulfobacterium sp.]|nr:4Fe-4S dicluster domain-containing protein [Desulfobacterium sp.]
MDSVTQIKEHGIVGSGGAGFPTHVKLGSRAEIVIVNAAECEPMLHKDKEILKQRTDTFFRGLTTLITAAGAKTGIIGIKEKHHTLIEMLNKKAGDNIKVIPIRDFYPAGDEITLIYETTGRVIGAGKLPITQGVIVNNVETIYNIGAQKPVTTKFLNFAGEVKNRVTVEVPLGISFRELIDFAEPLIDDFVLLVGGPMMGKLVHDLDEVVTKTTAALILLPPDHILVQRYRVMASESAVNKIGKSACDQCTLCTELCPRYLLGHPVQPHKAMRSLVFMDETGETTEPGTHALSCCECNLCSFVSCPEGLYPSTVTVNTKRKAMLKKLSHEGEPLNQAHALADYRRTPSRRLKSMLDLNRYPDEGPLVAFDPKPTTLKILLHQHIGAPATPLVKEGDLVTVEQKIATPGKNLGAEIHAPVNGRVQRVTDTFIQICSVELSCVELSCAEQKQNGCVEQNKSGGQ